MWTEYLTPYIGRNIAVWCARYAYRGQLEKVGEQCLLLRNPYAVEVSGSATSKKVETEDKIPDFIIISLDAIEMVFRPAWVDNP